MKRAAQHLLLFFALGTGKDQIFGFVHARAVFSEPQTVGQLFNPQTQQQGRLWHQSLWQCGQKFGAPAHGTARQLDGAKGVRYLKLLQGGPQRLSVSGGKGATWTDECYQFDGRFGARARCRPSGAAARKAAASAGGKARHENNKQLLTDYNT